MNVMMVGPEIQSRGGISAVVIDYIFSGLLSDLSVAYFPTYSDGSRSTKVIFYLRAFFNILLNIAGYDIVHINTSYGWSFRRLLAIFILARMLRKKTIFHIHGSRFDQWYSASWKLDKWLTRFALTQADAVIALSVEWKRKLLTIQPDAKVQVIENAIHTGKFRKKKTKARPIAPYRILFLGRVGQRKGVYDIVEAATFLSSCKYKFTLAGDGETEELKNLILQKGLQDMIDVPGWISGKGKADLLEQADLFLLPSYHEGLPISILEAMASRLPVVSTPVGGIPQAVRENENGYLVPCGEPKALARAIERVFSEPGKWDKFSARSCQIVEKQFSMCRVKRQLGSLYQDLLDQTPTC